MVNVAGQLRKVGMKVSFESGDMEVMVMSRAMPRGGRGLTAQG